MKKEDLLNLGLDEESATKIATASEEELKGYIAKADYDGVVTAKTTLEGQLKDRDKDIANLKKSAGNNTELSQKYGELETRYKTEKETLQKQLSDSAKHSAIDMAIMTAKGRNPKAVKALLDMEKISVKEDGTLEGFDLETLKKSDPYLFDVEESHIEGTGGGAGGNKTPSASDLKSQFESAVFNN